MLIWALDDRNYDHCGIELFQAAKKRGHNATLFHTASEVLAPGYVFMRLCQKQPRLDEDRRQYELLQSWKFHLTFIQDRGQIVTYENKLAQTAMWESFMPPTRVFHTVRQAREYAATAAYPLVSKSSAGSASHNVRILANPEIALREIDVVFGPGLKASLEHQRGYWLVQECIPHSVTYRVTAVGTKRHIYQRFNYPDRQVAAPSAIVRTKPLPMGELAESILEFSNKFFAAADTQWCAIDVLQNPAGGWFLLETALGWARGNDESGNAKFYGTEHSLLTQHELLLDEMAAGVFG